MSCGGKSTVHKIDLKNFPLEPVILQFNKSVLKFSVEEGVFKQIENNNQSEQKKKSNTPYYLAEIENSKLNINRYNETIKKLQDGIIDVENKKAKLIEMLKCDLAEKDYLEELKRAIGDYRQTIDDIKEIQNNTQSQINENRSIHTEYIEEVNEVSSRENNAREELKRILEEPEGGNPDNEGHENNQVIDNDISEVQDKPVELQDKPIDDVEIIENNNFNQSVEVEIIKEKAQSIKDDNKAKSKYDNEFIMESTEENLLHNQNIDHTHDIETFEV